MIVRQRMDHTWLEVGDQERCIKHPGICPMASSDTQTSKGGTSAVLLRNAAGRDCDICVSLHADQVPFRIPRDRGNVSLCGENPMTSTVTNALPWFSDAVTEQRLLVRRFQMRFRNIIIFIRMTDGTSLGQPKRRGNTILRRYKLRQCSV